jgi:hypothetical protein
MKVPIINLISGFELSGRDLKPKSPDVRGADLRAPRRISDKEPKSGLQPSI